MSLVLVNTMAKILVARLLTHRRDSARIAPSEGKVDVFSHQETSKLSDNQRMKMGRERLGNHELKP